MSFLFAQGGIRTAPTTKSEKRSGGSFLGGWRDSSEAAERIPPSVLAWKAAVPPARIPPSSASRYSEKRLDFWPVLWKNRVGLYDFFIVKLPKVWEERPNRMLAPGPEGWRGLAVIERLGGCCHGVFIDMNKCVVREKWKSGINTVTEVLLSLKYKQIKIRRFLYESSNSG